MKDKNYVKDMPELPLKPYPATTDYITDRERNDSKLSKKK